MNLARTIFCLMVSFINKLIGVAKGSLWDLLVDDIFVLFRSPHHFEKFNKYLNTKHANIKFTCENEFSKSVPSLDVLISRKKEGFTTTVYHKPIFCGVYSNVNSFIADEYKHGLIFTFPFQMFSIISVDF